MIWRVVSRDKPPQVGNTWPILVKGKMSLVVPDGGKCCGCETDLSGRLATYVCNNKEWEDEKVVDHEAGVSPWVKDNIVCW